MSEVRKPTPSVSIGQKKTWKSPKRKLCYLIEDNYQQRYAGFNPNSSESYIIFEFLQDKNMEKSVKLATLIQKQFKTSARRIDKGVHQAGFSYFVKHPCPVYW